MGTDFPDKQTLCRRRYRSFDEEIGAGAVRETESSCSPEGREADYYVLASPVTAPQATTYWGTPLDADRLSRLIPGRYSPCTGPARKFSFRGFPGPYTATVHFPEGCYSSREIDEIRTTILQLNTFAKVPVTTFRWGNVSFLTRKRESEYDWHDHIVSLSHASTRGSYLPHIQETKSDLAHEMGHVIYRKGFWKDRDWEKVYWRSLVHRNYEILHDANYLRDAANDSVGHPWDDPDEAFASAVRAYFLNADQFASYILNEKTPPAMKMFGRLVWTFLRDRVFRGLVFTSDDRDPFSGERFEALLKRLPGKRESLATFFRNDPDVNVRRSIAFNLHFRPGGDAGNEVSALTVAVQDVDFNVRQSAMWALMWYGPEARAAVPALIRCLRHEDPKTRRYAAMTLDHIGPTARSALPALRVAVGDPNPDVAQAAHDAWSEIFFSYR